MHQLMHPVSPFDATFLSLDSLPHAHFHIAVLALFRMPARSPVDYLQKLHTHLGRFAATSAPFNYRPLPQRGLARFQPTWEEVEAALDHHLRRAAVPWPGGELELGELISRLHATPLDMSRPLWELHLIEGLAGERFAIYFKVHHSIADGVSLMEMYTRWLTDTAGAALRPPPWAAARRKAAEVPPRRRAPPRKLVDRLSDLYARLGSGLAKAPPCILNGDITDRRYIATKSFALARFKALARAADGTINDIVLAACSGALRSYLARIDAVPEQSLIAMIPVAIERAPGQHNAVTAMGAMLATDVVDVRERVNAIQLALAEAKQRVHALSPAMIKAVSAIGSFVGPLIKDDSVMAKLPQVFNVAVSNVHGPDRPLYLNHAKLEAMYPASILATGQRLNITVVGYNNTMSFGLTACPDTLPHVQQLTGFLEDALRELERALLHRRTRRTGRDSRHPPPSAASRSQSPGLKRRSGPG